MSGYIDRSDPDIPLMTRERWVGVTLIIAAGLLMLLGVFARKGALPASLDGLTTLGTGATLLWILAGSVLLQPDSAPDNLTIPRRTPRSRRLIAAFMFTIGLVLLFVPAFI